MRRTPAGLAVRSPCVGSSPSSSVPSGEGVDEVSADQAERGNEGGQRSEENSRLGYERSSIEVDRVHHLNGGAPSQEGSRFRDSLRHLLIQRPSRDLEREPCAGGNDLCHRATVAATSDTTRARGRTSQVDLPTDPG